MFNGSGDVFILLHHKGVVSVSVSVQPTQCLLSGGAFAVVDEPSVCFVSAPVT